MHVSFLLNFLKNDAKPKRMKKDVFSDTFWIMIQNVKNYTKSAITFEIKGFEISILYILMPNITLFGQWWANDEPMTSRFPHV